MEAFHNRGAVLMAPGEFREQAWQQVASPDDVVLRVDLCGMCGTDVHVAAGHGTRVSLPALLGHEVTGTVASAPAGLVDVHGRAVRAGDRVLLASSSLGECQQCLACNVLGAPWQCVDRASMTVDIGGTAVAVVGGGLAEFMRVPAARANRLVLAADVLPRAAVLHEPLSVAVRTVTAGPTILGEDVVVQGTGAIGLLTILVARVSGAANIIAIGGVAGRLRRAAAFGADHVIDIDEVGGRDARIEAVLALTPRGRGAAVVYEVAGIADAVTEGLAFLRPSGVLVEAGNAADTGTTPLSPHAGVQAQSRAVVGVRGVRTRDFLAAGRLLARFEDELAGLVTHQIPLKGVGGAVRAMGNDYRLDGRDMIKVVVAPGTGFDPGADAPPSPPSPPSASGSAGSVGGSA